MRRTLFNEDHETFRKTLRTFIENEVTPHYEEWFEAGLVPREFYYKLAELGLFGIEVPEEYGGAGIESYKYQVVQYEEMGRAAVNFGGAGVHVDLCLPYLLSLGTPDQLKDWMPGFVSGETMYAIAMTEPGAGSDLAGMSTTAKLSEDGTHYVLNGAKTFITGGYWADRVIVCARTDKAKPDDRRHGISLLIVDSKAEGYSVGRKLDKIGLRTSDTAELAFVDVKVPVTQLLGEENKGFSYLGANLPRERLGIALGAYTQAAAAVRLAQEYTQQRMVFGKPVASFQNTKFELAECQSDVDAMQAVVRSRRGGHRPRRADRGRRRQGQAVLHRAVVEGDRSLPAAARRLRLHERVPDRAALRRQPRDPDLRRDHRGDEDDHRQGHGPVTSPPRRHHRSGRTDRPPREARSRRCPKQSSSPSPARPSAGRSRAR